MVRFLERLGAIGILSRDFLRCLFRRPFELGLIIDQLDELGVRSLNLVNLTAIFTGMVLALQMGLLLSRFGAKVYVSRIMGLSLFREMGPVLTALLVAGRVGSGISAELGSMQVTDQIDAMRSLGTNPIKKLVMPRVLATVLILPILTIFADAVGLLGGVAIAMSELGLTASYFFSSLVQNTELRDIFGGLGKSVIFGYLIAIIACQNGLDVTGGADGVGRAATSTVVTASVSILVADFFLTKLLMSI